MKQKAIGVILMTYGSPATLDDIPDYLTNVYHGKTPDKSVIREFQRRYKLIGGSPLIRITQDQAKLLEELLNKKNKNNEKYIVRAGMRFSPPFIKDVVQEIANRIDSVIGIIMSPQYSPIIMKGYLDTFTDAVKDIGIPYTIAGSWYENSSFIDAIAQRVRENLSMLSSDQQKEIIILFSAHSMPKRVVATEQDYINSLKNTAFLVAKRLNISDNQWSFCYQSAGHTPEEWLKPDFVDIMARLKIEGKSQVLIAPIQFLADHLEILYDIEIAAREQAEMYGIEFRRTESLNTSPLFIKALSEVVLENYNFMKQRISYEHIQSVE